ncbi:MAG: hypothetical protein V2A73_18855 [Pseudomonadota bacterium]
MTRIATAAAVVSLGLLSSCGDEPNQLSGSLSEVYDLEFDEVQAMLMGSATDGFLVVEYLRDEGKAIKLSVNLEGLTITPGEKFSLTELVGGIPRGTMQQIADRTRDFPMDTGTLALDQPLTPGASLAGHFRTVLAEPKGYSLNGDFSAVLEAIDL